jgi:hypothetical protein
MSLVRLLELGRSLDAIEETQSRYRMPRQNLLPKFGMAGAAIHRSPITASEPAGSAAPVRPSSKLADGAAEPLKREQTRSKWAKLIVSLLRLLSHLDRARMFVATKVKSLRKWSARSGAHRDVLRRRTASPSVLLPKPNPALVQTELSLDNVKVVRNDLSDSDFEVVPLATSRGSLQASPPAQVTTLHGSWGRLKARLFQEPVNHRNVADSPLGLKRAEQESGWPRF